MRSTCLEQEIHIWLARPEPHSLAQLVAQYEAILSEEERQRCQRFHFEHDRKHYLAAHALLRLALGNYLDLPPQQMAFTPGHNGKPQLVLPDDQPSLRFNLSHTRGLVACAMTLGRNCGIDVERIRPMKQLEGVAETVFSQEELAFLAGESRDEPSRLLAFFRLWTLKEAYIKSTGLGMSAPLRQISIDPASLRMKDATRPAEDSQDWLFDSWTPVPGHALALACEGAASIRSIVYHELDLTDGGLQVILCRQPGASGT